METINTKINIEGSELACEIMYEIDQDNDLIIEQLTICGADCIELIDPLETELFGLIRDNLDPEEHFDVEAPEMDSQGYF